MGTPPADENGKAALGELLARPPRWPQGAGVRLDLRFWHGREKRPEGDPRLYVCQAPGALIRVSTCGSILGSILGPSCVHIGSNLGPFCVHFGSILGPFLIIVEILMHL